MLVPHSLTAAAFLVHHFDLLLFTRFIIVEIVPCDMLAKLTAQSILFGLATAPPKLTRELRLVHATTPIKILRINEVLATELTNLEVNHGLKPLRL